MNKRRLPIKTIKIPALKDWSLAGKIILLVLYPIGIVLVVTLVLTVVGLNTLETDASASQLEEEVRIISQRFAEEQSSLQTSAAQLTTDTPLLNAIESNDRAALQKSIGLASIHSEFDYLQILDAEGQAMGKVEAFNFKDASSDLAKLSGLGLLEIEAFRLVPTPHGWLLTIVRPIKSQSGFVGVLSAGRLLDATALARLNFERTNPRLLIFDAQGNINAISQATDLSIADHDLWLQALTGETAIGHVNIEGDLQHIAYAPLIIGGRPASVFGLAFSTAATINLRDRLIITEVPIGIVFGVLAVISTLFISRKYIERPIAALVTGAEQAAAGNLDVVVDATSRDEIGILATAFNDMTGQLRKSLARLDHRAAQIATSAELSRRISSLIERKQLIDEVVERVNSTFNYYHTQIYFFDGTGQELLLARGTGEPGEQMLKQGHKISRGKGLVGRAAETNAPVIVSDTSRDPDWLPNPLLPETRSEIAVPISFGNQVIGVLDIQDNKPDSLMPEDANVLLSIASQIAITAHNARLLAEAQQRAEQEALISSISQKIQLSISIEDTLQIAIRELGTSIGARRVRAKIARSDDLDPKQN